MKKTWSKKSRDTVPLRGYDYNKCPMNANSVRYIVFKLYWWSPLTKMENTHIEGSQKDKNKCYRYPGWLNSESISDEARWEGDRPFQIPAQLWVLIYSNKKEGENKSTALLKIPSGHIRSAWEWYHLVGLGKDMNHYKFFDFIILILNFWREFEVLSRLVQKRLQSPHSSAGSLYRILSSYTLAHSYLMKKSARVLHYFWFGLRVVGILQIFHLLTYTNLFHAYYSIRPSHPLSLFLLTIILCCFPPPFLFVPWHILCGGGGRPPRGRKFN